MKKSRKITSSAEQTRRSLVEAALRLFGERGFAASSTRDIAAAAKANIGSIAYHFGSKDGLRLACAEHIVSTMQGLAGPALLDPAADAGPPLERLMRVLDTLGRFVVASPEAGIVVQFILREMAQPSPALDVIYDGIFEPVHRRLCLVWQDITGEDAESERTRLTVFSLIGQVVYFRIGKEVVLRRMGWRDFGAAEAIKVTQTASDNLAAVVDAHLASMEQGK